MGVSGESGVLRFGTRGSDLALWQTHHVIALLRAADPRLRVEAETIKTRGDRIVDKPLALVGGKGVFTEELEAGLREKRIDCAVHSLKDLPTDPPDGLVIGAIAERANPADVLISRRGFTLATLPQGARVGTSSYRRAAQLLHKRPDLKILDLRGNVDTRIRKALDAGGEYDAIVLAHAGVERLGQSALVSQVLPLEDVLPAPGQGAIAVQTRDDAIVLAILSKIHHVQSALAVAAERAFLAGLGGGCAVPVAACAWWDGEQLNARGRVSARDGSQQIDVSLAGWAEDEDAAKAAGTALAQLALERGAGALLEMRG